MVAVAVVMEEGSSTRIIHSKPDRLTRIPCCDHYFVPIPSDVLLLLPLRSWGPVARALARHHTQATPRGDEHEGVVVSDHHCRSHRHRHHLRRRRRRHPHPPPLLAAPRIPRYQSFRHCLSSATTLPDSCIPAAADLPLHCHDDTAPILQFPLAEVPPESAADAVRVVVGIDAAAAVVH